MTNRVLLATIISALLILSGCKQDVDTTTLTPNLYDYAPTGTGHYVIYDVDSTSYNFIQPGPQSIVTTHYQLRELLQDTFYDNLGKLSYRIELSKRTDTTQAFYVVDRAWYSAVSAATYEKVENDLRFVKLVFPVINGQTWSGNHFLPASDTTSDIYQTYANWVYTYSNVNQPLTVNGSHFDSTAVVTEVDNQNLIDKKLSRETYARHVGLIMKEWEVINKQDPTSSWDNPNQATGFMIVMKVHSYHL